jgi:ATP-dependent RNA helicase DeaD
MAQMKFLKHHPEIVVGTPGRVMDLLERRIINFHNVRFVVLDEVDRMLDIGFRDDIRKILSQVKGMSKRVPADAREGSPQDEQQTSDANAPAEATGHQTIFVSATISDEIEKLARRYMREPVEKLIAPGADDKPTVESVDQFYLAVQPWDKYRLLRMLLEQENPDLAIVFTKTKRGAEKLAKKLHADGIECREIHGNLAQNKRDHVMKGFRHGKFDVLIATDLASRGIDVADISHIIQYDISEDAEVYIHRIGRTARMGQRGKAFLFVMPDQGDELTKIEALINMVIPQAKLEGFEARPTPADWTEGKPGAYVPSGEAKPVINRYERAYSPSGASSSSSSSSGDKPAPVTIQAPPRTIGSKIPINRRHKRRR